MRRSSGAKLRSTPPMVPSTEATAPGVGRGSAANAPWLVERVAASAAASAADCPISMRLMASTGRPERGATWWGTTTGAFSEYAQAAADRESILGPDEARMRFGSGTLLVLRC